MTAIANITRRKVNITENDKFLSKLVVFLLVWMQKDIFGSFAYEFELLQK